MEIQLFDRLLLNNIGERLLAEKQTVAIAESVTSGLLQFAFSSIESAQQFFQGGVTAYNVAQKFKHLNVEPLHAIHCDCVSEKIAAEMAIQVAISFNSNWGIGITGYATPTPESGNKVFAYYAIAEKGVNRATKIIHAREKLPPGPQLLYVSEVLQTFNELLMSTLENPTVTATNSKT